MPISDGSNCSLAYPRRFREFFRRNLPEHVVQQIQSFISILLLNLIPIVDDFIFHIFKQIRFLAHVRDRNCLDGASCDKSARSPICGFAVWRGAFRLRVKFVFLEYVADIFGATACGLGNSIFGLADLVCWPKPDRIKDSTCFRELRQKYRTSARFLQSWRGATVVV